MLDIKIALCQYGYQQIEICISDHIVRNGIDKSICRTERDTNACFADTANVIFPIAYNKSVLQVYIIFFADLQ